MLDVWVIDLVNCLGQVDLLVRTSFVYKGFSFSNDLVYM